MKKIFGNMPDLIIEVFLDSCCELIINAFIYNLDATEVRMVSLRRKNYMKSAMPVRALRMLCAV